MKEYKTLSDICQSAIAIDCNIRVFWPHRNAHEVVAREKEPAFEMCYCTNNSTISFIYKRVQYVIPYMKQVMNVIKNAGLKYGYFFVPFSNGDYPEDFMKTWDDLKNEARQHSKVEFIETCNRFADQYGFGTISEELLKKCFKMPKNGVPVKHTHFETIHYPAIKSECLDCVAADFIGRYCTNNGVLTFVYRDGATYVTRDYSVIPALRNAGYIEATFYVPFSNGEKILHPEYASRWNQICSSAT